jgi:hypothetical protein
MLMRTEPPHDDDDDDFEPIDPLDLEALERSIEMARAESPARAEQIDDFLADPERTWWDTASFCSYVAQGNALNLPPWQSPPCWTDPDQVDAIIARGDDGVMGDYAAAILLKRMLQAGLSQYEPDPIAALERVKHPPNGRPSP